MICFLGVLLPPFWLCTSFTCCFISQFALVWLLISFLNFLLVSDGHLRYGGKLLKVAVAKAVKLFADLLQFPLCLIVYVGFPLGILGVIILNILIIPADMLSLVALWTRLSVADWMIWRTFGQFSLFRRFCLWLFLPFCHFWFITSLAARIWLFCIRSWSWDVAAQIGAPYRIVELIRLFLSFLVH